MAPLRGVERSRFHGPIERFPVSNRDLVHQRPGVARPFRMRASCAAMSQEVGLSSDVMIEASGLTKRFGSVRALDKVSFEVNTGEVVGFLGPNGAGKSTTMRILTCFISATSGTARVYGHDVFDDPLEVRQRIGYLPQRAPLYGEMSVWEYLSFVADMRGLDAGTFKTRMKREIVEVCGLAQVL